ncbi:unnamed protein product [Lymnaea stagnalis]|uniref:Reelin domain-containing protein n=1 Tax=Lymnaea stagnalis TaxID=6523 RepID=A0AAV2HJS1_LYMST
MYIAAIFVASILGCSHAFPSGAHNNGSNIMESMSSYCTAGHFRPNHANHLPQSTAAPYTITVTSPAGTMYKHGQPVTITLAGTSGRQFKGFFIQGDCTEVTFEGTITCGSQGHNVTFCGKSGATHSNAVPKDQVVCTWNPPEFQIGKVQFIATFVENFSIFWSGVRSSTTLVADPTALTYAQQLQRFQMLLMQRMNGAGGE